jgi:phosphoglycolate phosphatase
MTSVRASTWPQAFLFDLDGTLIDSAPDLAAAANLVLARDGLGPLPLSAVRSMIGHGVRALIDQAYRACDHPLDSGALDLAEAAMMAFYGTHMTVLTTLMPGTFEALDAAQERGAALGVVTNKPLGLTQAILDHFTIASCFDVMIGGDFGLAPKPAPDLLLAALDQLSLSPADAVMIGDSITDIKAATAAGIRCVAVDGGYSDQPAASLGAHHVIASLAALPTLLDTWS